jgi:hypothetical protein
MVLPVMGYEPSVSDDVQDPSGTCGENVASADSENQIVHQAGPRLAINRPCLSPRI